MYTFERLMQGRKRARLNTCCVFLSVQKLYAIVGRNGLWKQLSKYEINRNMWRMLQKIAECTTNAVILDGELSEFFNILQGLPQGCTLSPTPFQVFHDKMLNIVEAVVQGVKVGKSEVSGLSYADDFVGVSDTREGLQKQIDIAMELASKWRLSANVMKCAVMVCNDKNAEEVDFEWKWGDEELPRVDQYIYLGVEFSKDCMWDVHMKKVREKLKTRQENCTQC